MSCRTGLRPISRAWSVYIPEFDDRHTSMSCSLTLISSCAPPTGRIYRFGWRTDTRLSTVARSSSPLPFLSFDKPATFKVLSGLRRDLLERPGSTWSVQASFDPTVTPVPFDQICTLDGADHHGRAHPDQRAGHAYPVADRPRGPRPGDVLEALHPLRAE